MRKREYERSADFAWQVLRQAVYATVSMVDEDGTPYATPVNVVGDEGRNALYFHCAGAGQRWELLQNGAPVCVTAVSTAALIPHHFTTAYRSAMFRGRAQVVTDAAEKLHAMRLLCTAFDPDGMERFDASMAHCTAQVIRITPEAITGKEHMTELL